MTKKLPELWLQYAKDDLHSAETLMKASIYNMVCFHSQQAVEKTLKAIIAFYDKDIMRTHNLIRLYKICEDFHHEKLFIEEDWLIFLNDVYIDSRYPADFGVLPGGQPDQNDAGKALKYANSIFERLRPIIEEDQPHISQ
jgi:HEPN domain-containing protein